MSKPGSGTAAWAFTAVAVGGVVLGLGAALFLIRMLGAAHGLGPTGSIAIAAGGAILGIGWVGFVASGDANVSLPLGAFALPAGAIAALTATMDNFAVRMMLFFGALCLFAITHFFALGTETFRKLAGARIASGIAMLGLGILAFAVGKSLDISQSVASLLLGVGLGGMALMGFALVAISRLRR